MLHLKDSWKLMGPKKEDEKEFLKLFCHRQRKWTLPNLFWITTNVHQSIHLIMLTNNIYLKTPSKVWKWEISLDESCKVIFSIYRENLEIQMPIVSFLLIFQILKMSISYPLILINASIMLVEKNHILNEFKEELS